MSEEIDLINAIASHPAMEAIALVQAAERNDTETMYRMCEDSPDMYAVASWLCCMVRGALDVNGYTIDGYLDAVARNAIEFIKGDRSWGVSPSKWGDAE